MPAPPRAAGPIAWAPQPIAQPAVSLVRTNRTSGSSIENVGTASYTTAAFTPSNNSLLVVVLGIAYAGTSATPTNATVVDSAGLTWTRQLEVSASAANEAALQVWTAPVTTGVSMTITVDEGADSVYAYFVDVVDYTGYDTSSPIGASVTNTALSEPTGPMTLSAAPASTSEVIAARVHNAAAIGFTAATPGSGWTELYDQFPYTGGAGMESQVRGGSTSTSIAWTNVNTTPVTAEQLIGLAIEIKQAPGGSGTATPSQLAFHRPFSLSRLASPILAGAIAWVPQPIAPTATQTPTDLDFVQPFVTSQLPALKPAPQPAWTPQPPATIAFGWYAPALPVTAPKLAAAGQTSWEIGRAHV